jgi:hypothetical protein
MDFVFVTLRDIGPSQTGSYNTESPSWSVTGHFLQVQSESSEIQDYFYRRRRRVTRDFRVHSGCMQDLPANARSPLFVDCLLTFLSVFSRDRFSHG